jgi:predicted acyltransferase
VGSFGYLFTDTCYMLECYPEQSKYMNIFLGVLFVFDALFYTFACFDGETSRAPAHMEFSMTFSSTFDWYLAACTLFIVGSVMYFIASIQDYYGEDTTMIYFVAALNFMVDSVLYLMSAFHRRDPDLDVPICKRGIWVFSIYGASRYPSYSERKNAYHAVQ